MNRHELYLMTRNLMTHGGVAIVFFSAGMMMVENNNHNFIAKVKKTDVQEYLLQKGMATYSTFSEAAQVAVDRKTMEIVNENTRIDFER